jgi:hypothetical protein
MDAGARIARWVESMVIGLDLCPFAAAVWRSGRVRTSVSDAATPADAVQAVLQESVALLESSETSTTLVVFPGALADFEEFLDAVATAESALIESGAEGLLQIATFHPQYRFDGTAPDDLSNSTNRAPYPVIQLLRESEVADAVDHHPDPAGIPARNVARLSELGPERVRSLLDDAND